jgi:hypothetical protein
LDRGKLRLALDIGLRTVSREECEAFFASGAIRQVFLDASKHSFAVVARFAQTAGHLQDEVGGGVAAMALATVRHGHSTGRPRSRPPAQASCQSLCGSGR